MLMQLSFSTMSRLASVAPRVVHAFEGFTGGQCTVANNGNMVSFWMAL
jgi:hypothetical protein